MTLFTALLFIYFSTPNNNHGLMLACCSHLSLGWGFQEHILSHSKTSQHLKEQIWRENRARDITRGMEVTRPGSPAKLTVKLATGWHRRILFSCFTGIWLYSSPHLFYLFCYADQFLLVSSICFPFMYIHLPFAHWPRSFQLLDNWRYCPLYRIESMLINRVRIHL